MKEKTTLNIFATCAYGIGAIGKDMVYALVFGFFMYYLNTLYGVSSVFIGTLFMFARIFDAFNDPLMGIIVSKTNTPWGKFRPWIFIGTILNALVLYFMFAMPTTLTQPQLLLYLSISYILWGLTYTIMDIPYWSMIPNITTSGKEREILSVVARACAGLGFAIPTALTMLLVKILGGENPTQGFKLLTLFIAIIFCLTSTITVLGVKEKTQNIISTPTTKELLKALLANDQALYIVITIVLFNASLYLTQNLALYYFQYNIGNADLFGIFATVGGVFQILAMIILPALRKKFSKRYIFIAAIGLAILGYICLFFFGIFNITEVFILCIAAAIIFTGFGLATVLTTIFLADTVDYGEYKSGQRNDSIIFSLQTFVVKLASAISVFISGIGLKVIGLNVDSTVQSSQTLLGMSLLMTLIPIIGLLITIFIFSKKYTLTENYLASILSINKGEHYDSSK